MPGQVGMNIACEIKTPRMESLLNTATDEFVLLVVLKTFQ